jgi:DNA-binding transcriptional MerR regulator
MSELSRSEDSRYDLGLLFTDGMPDLDDTAGYRGAIAARAAGISYRQLDYWARTELVEPTVRGAAGSGSQRLYGFRDILVLKLVKRLLDTGISLQQIRTAVNQLREAGVSDLAQTTLMSDGASVYLCTSDDEVIDLVSRGQGVFGIAVGKVLREVESSLIELDSVKGEDPADELATRQFHQLRRSSLLTSVFQEHVGQFDTEWPGNGHLSTAAYDGWLAYSPRRAVRITRSSS